MSDYNGYKNYNTWNIVLWMHNDERAYFWVKGLAEAKKTLGFKWRYRSSFITARDIFESVFGKPETPDGVKVSSKDIDWNQVADALNENI